MLPTIPRRINSVTETRSRVVTPNITRATNERRCIPPDLAIPLVHIHTHTHGCKFVTVLAYCTRNGRCARWRLHRILTLFRERQRKREGTGGHFVDNVFQRRLHGNVRRIDIRSTPRGGGRRPEGAGATRGTAVVRVKRDETMGAGGFTRRRTCVPDDASLFGDGDHYSIRFHFSFEEKRLNDMRPLREVVQFFFPL